MLATATSIAVVALAAAPGDFSFEGIPAEASTTSGRAFVATGPDPSLDAFEDGQGRASVRVVERVDAPGATYGDDGSFEAELRVGLRTYRISGVTAGAPPVLAGDGARAQQLALPFRAPLEGGVALNQVALGGSGVGPRGAPARAAFVLFGRATLTLDGRVVAEAAPVQVLALATGVHADDATHRRLPSARPGDLELVVFFPRVESGLIDRGYFYAVFEDVRVSVGGRSLRASAEVPVEGRPPRVRAPVVVELEEIPDLVPPAFEGFARAGPAEDALPLPADPTPATPQPLNAAGATPLPATPGVTLTPPPAVGPAVSATQPAAPLPEAILPLNAAPDGAAPGTTPAIPPANAEAATPFLQTPPPLNTQPGSAGPSGPAPAPSVVPGAPPLVPSVDGAPTPGTGPLPVPGAPSTPGTPGGAALTPGTPAPAPGAPALPSAGNTSPAPGATPVPGAPALPPPASAPAAVPGALR